MAEQTREHDRVWNNSRDLIAVVDNRGTFRLVSPSWTRVLGYETADLIGHSYVEFLAPEDVAATQKAAAAVLSDGRLDGFENRYRHKDGSVRWISWQALVEDGLLYAYGRDVTAEKARDEEFRRTEEQLRQSQKMEAVGQLTGGLAHDFNNMLTAIMGGLELIHRRIHDGRLGDLDRFMDGAMKSAKRAAGLTHRLLAFSRQQTLDPKSVDVNALVKSMEDLLVRTLGEQVRLKVVANADAWPALSDVNQLESALLNLAINARDAMPDGGQLTIEVENVVLDHAYVVGHLDSDNSDYVSISVTDTGHGMDAGTLSKAFDPFFTTKPIGQGTGLGLSTIYGFLRQIGGHASLSSEVGKGTTVRMYPATVHQSGATRRPQSRSDSRAGRRRPDRSCGRGRRSREIADCGSADETGVSSAASAERRRRYGPPYIINAARPSDQNVGLPGLNGRQVAEIARRSRPGCCPSCSSPVMRPMPLSAETSSILEWR